MRFSGLLALPLCVFMTVTAAASGTAIDMDYDGLVDPHTGEPAYVTGTDEEQQSQTVTLADGGVYDKEEDTYKYYARGQTKCISSNVASGMITTDEVSIEVDDDMDVSLYCDGELVTEAYFSHITDTGSYTVLTNETETDQQLMTFRIVSDVTGDIELYDLPAGFVVREVSIDGVEQEINDKSKIDFSKEGNYIITYRCRATAIDYGMELYIDHTAPDVILNGVEDGKARGPVTLTGMTDSDSVTVFYNDNEIKMDDDNTVRSPGDYEVIVTDDAGNEQVEQFRIEMYLNAQGFWFSLLTAAVIILGAAYMYRSRTRLRVR